MSEPGAARRQRLPVLVIFALGFAGAFLIARNEPARVAPVHCSEAAPPGASTVVMLSAAWCGYCARARQLLVERGVDYCEYDIERSATGAAQYAEGGYRGVPVIRVGARTLLGYDRETLLDALAARGDGAGARSDAGEDH